MPGRASDYVPVQAPVNYATQNADGSYGSREAAIQAATSALPPEMQELVRTGVLTPNVQQHGGVGQGGATNASYEARGFVKELGDGTFDEYDPSGKFIGTGQSGGGGGFLGKITQAANVLPNLAMAAGINFVTSGAASAIGGQLMNAGVVTSTAAANAAGAAIIRAGVSIAGGADATQAIKDAATSVLASQTLSPAVSAEVKGVISNPTIANTVSSMGTNIIKGLATGQSQDQIMNSVAGSFANSLFNSATSGTKTADASDAVQNDFNTMVASGVDPDTALATAMQFNTDADVQQVSDNEAVDDSLLPTNNQAVASGMSPGSVGAQEAAAGNLSQDELAAAQGVDTSGLDALTPAPVSLNQAVASGMSPGSVGAQEAAAGNLSSDQLASAQGVDTSGLDALNAQNVRTAGSSPGSAEAATRLTDPMDLLAAGAGASGSLPTALGNEAVASGMSPGSLGAQAAADNSLLDSQQSAVYGTSNVADLTGGTARENNLTRSPNEAVASGLSPGSAGAAQAAAGTLTDAQLAAASGTNNSGGSTNVRTNTGSNTSGATSATTGGLPTAPTAPSVIPGQVLRLGKMGSDMNQHQLKQLYGDLLYAPAPSQAYTYDTTDPEYLDVAKMNSQPFTTQPMYARGGLVQHFAEGDQPDPTRGFANMDDLAKSLKNVADAGKIGKIYPPTVLVNGNVGTPKYTPKVIPQLAEVLRARGMHLAEGGQPNDHEHPEYDGTPVFRTGGLEGLGGKYVEGKGDGTSDDITAMLADGEYVFSADVVAALGNGSNKAGAEKLNEMVHAIRARARSASPDKLAPDAKSPLEYLKSSKGKKNG